MKIVLASPEVVPFAKTGGLADVAGALPKALARLGMEVIVVMPLYGSIDKKKHGIKRLGKKVSAKMDTKEVEAELHEGELPGGVKTYFLDVPSYYGREQLYGTSAGDYPDNAERFMFLAKAVPQVVKALQFKPDVVHLNDWQTALVPLYLKQFHWSDPFFDGAATVFTVHNLGYQGLFWVYDMPLTGLGWDQFTPEGIEYYGRINVLKAGLVNADVINTVSKTYAKEVQTPEFGHGLDGVLRSRATDLFGIVNGIDYDDWNPQTDSHLFKTYGPGDVKGKQANKKQLKNELGLAAGNKPLFGMISRLADQKGLDILSGAFKEMMKMDLQVVILGTGDEKYHELLSSLAKKWRGRMSVNLKFDAGLAARIYAGSDVFLMPSRYEPCGLGQLISFRYGTVPLVRKTGGLADTVKNFSQKTGRGNGFVFSEYSSRALMRAVRAAAKAYADKKAWATLVERGMTGDYSWTHSAKEYIKLYEKALEKARARNRSRAAA